MQAVLAALNRVLAIEGWAVELEGIAPVLRRRVPGLAPIAPAKPEWPDPPDFATIASDSSFAEILHKRWIEAQTCMSAGAHTASLVMIGSLLEGALLAVARAKPEAANRANACPKDKRDKPRPLEQWTLNHLIDVAHECGWIERDRKDFSHALRDYRNIVHPWHQRELRAAPDSDTCNICWGVAKAVLNDLGQA